MSKQLMALIPAQVESVAVVAPPMASSLFPGLLPPELVTGHKVIDEGHAHLLATMARLRQVCTEKINFHNCSSCTGSVRAGCENDLIGVLGDLFAFVLDHFKVEEEIMRDSLLLMVDRDVCEAHMEDHAAISGKVQEIVAALDPMNTVILIRELDTLLARWVSNHTALHDALLVRWLEREDSVLKQAHQVKR